MEAESHDKNVAGSLDFVKNKEKWGTYLQGGVVKITEEDYKFIVESTN